MNTIQRSQASRHSAQKSQILLCVTGLSPQIVTETLYALAVAQEVPWIPSEIRLLTTTRGAQNAKLMLLSDQPGWFHRLRQDWALPHIAFDESHIEVITSSAGEPLDDILDDADNQCAADCIADCVRRLTQDDHTAVHASMAGGRKTMGFFMGYAMSLWGRPQDRLSHVLVSAPYESRAEFFYPTPTPFVIAAKDRGQDPLDASKARVWLGNIPFVRLRHLLPETLRAGQGKFADAVSAANTALEHVSLEIDMAHSSIRLNGTRLRLQPMQFALLTLLAWRQKKHLPPLQAPNKEGDDPEWKQQGLRHLQDVWGEMNIPDSVYRRLIDTKAMGDTFNEQLSKLKRALRDSGALPFRELVVRTEEVARARQRHYQLALSASHIHFISPEAASKLAKPAPGSHQT